MASRVNASWVATKLYLRAVRSTALVLEVDH